MFVEYVGGNFWRNVLLTKRDTLMCELPYGLESSGDENLSFFSSEYQNVSKKGYEIVSKSFVGFLSNLFQLC